MQKQICSYTRYSFLFFILSFIVYWGGNPIRINNISSNFCEKIAIRPRTRKNGSSIIPVKDKSDVSVPFRLKCENERQAFIKKKFPLKLHSLIVKVADRLSVPFSLFSFFHFPVASVPLYVK